MQEGGNSVKISQIKSYLECVNQPKTGGKYSKVAALCWLTELKEENISVQIGEQFCILELIMFLDSLTINTCAKT